MQKLLTIVIPTYNMQDYLRVGLDSLVVSSEWMPMLEVLVINDGSKDNSSAIAHEYEARYPETFRVIDKENGNYGSCVNRGLKEATGKYIKLLDADDWYDTAALEQLMSALQTHDVDMALSPFMCCYEDGMENQLVTQAELQPEVVYIFNKLDTNTIARYGMPMITYRTELLRKIQYVQTEGMSYTDTEWVMFPQYTVDTFVWVPSAVYCYRLGREGQTMDANVLAKNIWKYEVIAWSLIENSRKYPHKEQYPLAEEFNIQQITFLAENIYRMFLVLVRPTKEDTERLKHFDAYLKEACPEAYRRVGLSPMKKWLPLRYVKLWRATGWRLPVDAVREIYRRVKHGRKG